MILADRAQALQYLRKLCSHPLLVLDQSVPEHVAAVHAELGGNWAAAQVTASTLVMRRAVDRLFATLNYSGVYADPTLLLSNPMTLSQAPRARDQDIRAAKVTYLAHHCRSQLQSSFKLLRVQPQVMRLSYAWRRRLCTMWRTRRSCRRCESSWRNAASALGRVLICPAAEADQALYIKREDQDRHFKELFSAMYRRLCQNIAFRLTSGCQPRTERNPDMRRQARAAAMRRATGCWCSRS